MFDWCYVFKEEIMYTSSLKYLFFISILFLSGINHVTAQTSQSKELFCSSDLSFLSSCPNDMKSVAQNASPIPVETSCSGFFACIGEIDVSVRYDYFTFFDVENNEVTKFQVAVTPTIMTGPIATITGEAVATEIQPSSNDLELSQAFYDIIYAKKMVQDSISLTQAIDGSFTDGHGSSASNFGFSATSCRTALDYVAETEDRACAADLSRDIRSAIRDASATFSFLSSLDKLEALLRTRGIDVTGIGKLSEFRLVIHYDDGSELVIDVTFKEGSIEISLNEKASVTTTGRTFESLSLFPVVQSDSLPEAEVLAGSGLFMLQRCEEREYPLDDTYVLVASYRDENGNYVHVYERQENFIIITICSS